MSTDTTIRSERKTTTSYFARLVYTVFWLNVLALLFFVVGLIAGWFWPEAELIRNGAYRVSVVVNTEEAKQDISNVAEATQNAAETGASVVDRKTIEGEITEVAPDLQEVVIVDKDQEYKVAVTDATDFEVNGDNNIFELAVGDQVRVTFKQKGDNYFADSIRRVEQP